MSQWREAAERTESAGRLVSQIMVDVANTKQEHVEIASLNLHGPVLM